MICGASVGSLHLQKKLFLLWQDSSPHSHSYRNHPFFQTSRVYAKYICLAPVPGTPAPLTNTRNDTIRLDDR
jgi:hypothetical protein